MLCMLFNVYISTIRYVLLISPFADEESKAQKSQEICYWSTHQLEKLGFEPQKFQLYRALNCQSVSYAVSWQGSSSCSPWAVDSSSIGEMTVNTKSTTNIHVYTDTHTHSPRFKILKWCITYKVWQFAYVCIYVIQLYIIDLVSPLYIKDNFKIC